MNKLNNEFVNWWFADFFVCILSKVVSNLISLLNILNILLTTFIYDSTQCAASLFSRINLLFCLSVPLYATRMPQLINRKQVERPNSCRLWGKFRAHKNETWIFLGRQWGCGGRRRMRKKKRGKNKSNRRKKKCNKTSELLERDAPGQTVRERKEESERKQNNKAEY